MASDDFQKGLGLGPQQVGDVSDEATVIELSGVIKWFDVSKGYGFIVPDNGGADILLHVTCLRRDGFQTAYEGARVVAEVLQRPKGYQCFRILSMDESTAIHPSTLPPARTHVTVTPTSGLERAMVKWFNRLRGFGFLTRGEGTPGHLRPHGDAAPLRPRRAPARPDRAGAVRARPEGADGGRGAAG
jgi:Cold shock proteins